MSRPPLPPPYPWGCVVNGERLWRALSIIMSVPSPPPPPPYLLPERLILQPHVAYHGHAIEARVYAEDPFRKFLPSTGPLVTYREPTISASSPDNADAADAAGGGAAAGGVRVDAGVVEGSTVSMFYDPMISKVTAYGESRENALERLGTALDGE